MTRKGNRSQRANSFRSLLQEIEREVHLEPRNRSSEHFSKTLAIFEAADIDELDHEIWRQCLMLPAMLEILRYDFFDLNPILREAAYIATLQPDDPRVAYWQQEIDDDGYTQEELAARYIPVYPSYTREELEIYVARKHTKRN
jgi:hypothetical protein